MKSTEQILSQHHFNKKDLIHLLSTNVEESRLLFAKAAEVKKEVVRNKVYFRGLIEYSNLCRKNCYYCGIRGGNKNVTRYQLTEREVLDAAAFAYKNNYASIVIQSGERNDKKFSSTISRLLRKIKELSHGELGITLSLGEQDEETYAEWFASGGHRYLLRIEVSNRDLYSKLHPGNAAHDYDTRIQCLHLLRKIGYQVGTGVMIGLPFQTISDLADDLIFFRDFDIDMVGMGPYIEHVDTPMYKYKNSLLPLTDRFRLTLKMIALLRIILRDINIAATTAMQTIDKQGREKALKVGANVIMPNLTPVKYRENYLLYENKPCLDENAEQCKGCLEARVYIAGDKIGYGEWGDSERFKIRLKRSLAKLENHQI